MRWERQTRRSGHLAMARASVPLRGSRAPAGKGRAFLHGEYTSLSTWTQAGILSAPLTQTAWTNAFSTFVYFLNYKTGFGDNCLSERLVGRVNSQMTSGRTPSRITVPATRHGALGNVPSGT